MKFQGMNVTQRLILGFSVPVLMFAAFGVWLWTVMGDITEIARQTKTESIVFAMYAKNMERNVVDVQQFLSDISATRAQDGLDDGFREAKRHYDDFNDDLSKFQKMFSAEGNGDGLKRTEQIKERFDQFYTMGTKMAHAYVDGGPASGNKLMGEFDKVREELQTALEPFVKSQLDEMKSNLGKAESMADQSRKNALMANVFITGQC